MQTIRPIVIAHRGASGYVPEHTLVSYFIAIQQGADYIEPDLVMTRDGVLVARHENEIGSTTDVAEHPVFADRRITKTIDGVAVTGWFTEDFSLSELKRLRARERLPELRSGNARFDRMFEIPTLQEILALVHTMRATSLPAGGTPRAAARTVGVYPETKHPSYFASLGLAMEESLVRILADFGYVGKQAPVFVQSFEVGNLQALRKLTQLPLVQLIEGRGKPFDFTLQRDARTYAHLVTRNGLREIASYADAVGVHKDLIVPRAASGALEQATSLVADAHANGLQVHAWTLRAENHFLPPAYRSSKDPAQHGDLAREIEAFLAAGVDGFFVDQPDIGVKVRDAAHSR